jgi:hypothetical protein
MPKVKDWAELLKEVQAGLGKQNRIVSGEAKGHDRS